MKTQKFGIEIEMTGITREQAAKVIAAYFQTGETNYVGGTYRTYEAKDTKGRAWKAMYYSKDKDINEYVKQLLKHKSFRIISGKKHDQLCIFEQRWIRKFEQLL